jgi:altronate dehydratase
MEQRFRQSRNPLPHEVANGRKVNNERKGYKEIAIFKTGVTL